MVSAPRERSTSTHSTSRKLLSLRRLKPFEHTAILLLLLLGSLDTLHRM